MEREWGRLPKKEELEQHIRELQRQCEELQDETALVRIMMVAPVLLINNQLTQMILPLSLSLQRTQDAQRYHEELDRKNYRLSNIMQEAVGHHSDPPSVCVCV